ncbi:MAG: glycosyltransferase [Rikenellaceae bacterium]
MKRLSLIIATYNRSAWVLETLASVAAQSAPAAAWECIVVDNNSKDDTRARVDEFIALHVELDIKYIHEPKQGLSHARNCGIENSSGEILAIIDDDELICPEFIAAYIELFDSYTEAASAGGKIIAQYRTARPSWMSHLPERAIANPIDFGEQVREFPKGRIPGGGNMAIRRSVLDRYGNFNTELGRNGNSLIGGEENELFERLARGGERCFYAPRAIMYHLIPDEKLTREYFARLCYNMGVSQKVRAKIAGRSPLFVEYLKWFAALGLALGYLLTLRPGKALYILIMRFNILCGLL